MKYFHFPSNRSKVIAKKRCCDNYQPPCTISVTSTMNWCKDCWYHQKTEKKCVTSVWLFDKPSKSCAIIILPKNVLWTISLTNSSHPLGDSINHWWVYQTGIKSEKRFNHKSQNGWIFVYLDSRSHLNLVLILRVGSIMENTNTVKPVKNVRGQFPAFLAFKAKNFFADAIVNMLISTKLLWSTFY